VSALIEKIYAMYGGSNLEIVSPLPADPSATGEQTEGEQTDGEQTGGEQTSGEQTDGEQTGGEHADGEATEGEATEGEATDGEATDGGEEKDETIVIRFDEDSPLRFPLRAALYNHTLAPSTGEDFGAFLTEEGRVESLTSIEIVSVITTNPDAMRAIVTGLGLAAKLQAPQTDGGDPTSEDDTEEGATNRFAYAVFNSEGGSNRIGLGFGIVIGGAPSFEFEPEEGETFDPTSAPWVRLAYDLGYADEDDDEGPLVELVKPIIADLRAAGHERFYSLVNYCSSFCGLSAKRVATFDDSDGDTWYVLDVSLAEAQEKPEDEPAAEELPEEPDPAAAGEPVEEPAAVAEEPGAED
jgi:hypothetical protein